MPHAGLMDENALGPEAGPLMRARLHMRGGKRRLKQGKISAGIITVSDALSAAMEWYIAANERRVNLQVREGENLNDDRTAFNVLTRSGIFDKKFDYEAFDKLVEKAAYQEMPAYDYREMLKEVESLMTQLGVMPFDESGLPSEDPATF